MMETLYQMKKQRGSEYCNNCVLINYRHFLLFTVRTQFIVAVLFEPPPSIELSKFDDKNISTLTLPRLA